MKDKRKKQDFNAKISPQTLLRSFRAVFTLPFRTVRFGFRRLAEIPWRNLVLMSLMAVIMLALTMVIFIKATSQPRFCVSCHYMQPYFASWEESTHSEVHCTECHFPPGIEGTVRGKFTAISMLVNYWTGVYKKSKPWAEISDESCLRDGCHETRLLEGKVPFKEGITFDHKPHLTEDRRGKNLRCTSCHSQIVQGSHMTVTEETCFLCHFKEQPVDSKMNSCVFCHNAPTGDDPKAELFDHSDMLAMQTDCKLCHGEMVKGEGSVSRERCSYCHAESGKLERYSETIELHSIHISENKVECNHCHNNIQHKSVARTGEIKPECKECHSDRHMEQYYLFSGQGAESVESLPSSMFHAGLNCKACHVISEIQVNGSIHTSTSLAGEASCEPCHDKSFYRLYKEAQPVIDQKINQTKNRIRQVKGKYRNQQAIDIIQQAEHDIELLKRGHPIHNLQYSDIIIEEVSRALDEIEGKKTPERKLPDEESKACVKCHYRQDETAVNYKGRKFSHKLHVHIYGNGCETCHASSEENHGRLESGNFCMDCHHESAAVSCDPCHRNQQNLIEGEGVISEYSADIMFEAGIVCRDCHEVEGRIVNRPDAESCEICHEPGYWEDYAVMRGEIAEVLPGLIVKLKEMPESKDKAKFLNMAETILLDGTDGAHNIMAAQDMIGVIKKFVSR